MPIYEYRCKECHQVFEEWTRHADEVETPRCPVCDSPSERIISNTTFVLKGGGWYATEYGARGREPKDAKDSAETAAKPAAEAGAGGAAGTPAAP
ncbi:MAG: zinc ribbon domain-containing protein, partial [Deltaproteobacteria bacterium]|nr:zinc ribbon domain-containing protein [Deltaproteobacteria bacterium]